MSEILERQITELDNESFSKLRDWFIEFEQLRWENKTASSGNEETKRRLQLVKQRYSL